VSAGVLRSFFELSIARIYPPEDACQEDHRLRTGGSFFASVSLWLCGSIPKNDCQFNTETQRHREQSPCFWISFHTLRSFVSSC